MFFFVCVCVCALHAVIYLSCFVAKGSLLHYAADGFMGENKCVVAPNVPIHCLVTYSKGVIVGGANGKIYAVEPNSIGQYVL